jgi:hypothetical protein
VGAQGSQEQREGPLSARPSECRTRCGGCGTRTSGASAALILARSGRTVAVVLLLIGSAASGAARAAAPDPSPQPAAASSAAGPTPDPAPQAQPSVQSQATPRPTESGVALGATAGKPSTVTRGRVTEVPITPVSIAPRSRPVSHRAHGRGARAAGRSASSQLQRRNRGLFGAMAGAAARPPTPQRNGVLLLLAASAVWALVIASASLLRLVGRIRDGLWEQ